ncbi:MAG: hypothetical protein RL326_1353 [Pseudomonadota bacterium]|jgi:hypothetical protein
MNRVAKVEGVLHPGLREKIHSMLNNLANDRRTIRSFDTLPEAQRRVPSPLSVRLVAYVGSK